MTVYEELKQNWQIRKSDITGLGINANKPWNEITVGELGQIADLLDVTIAELF